MRGDETFLNGTSIFLILKQNWAHLRHCPQQSKMQPFYMAAYAENTKGVAPLNCHHISWGCYVFCQTLNSFRKWSRSQEKKQSKRCWKQSCISIFWTLRERWALLLFSLSRSFFGSTGFYNPWLNTDRQALPTTDSVCGFKILTHNSLCHLEELAG